MGQDHHRVRNAETAADMDWDDNVTCIAADALNLANDCGGISGISGYVGDDPYSDKEEAQEMRD